MAKTYKELSAEEKKLIKRTWLRSHLIFCVFTQPKMQANGFTLAMIPAIESIYKDDEEGRIDAYRRHQQFFNTHTVPTAFIEGLTVAMEKEKKEKGSVTGETISAIKAALMGPTAGMFDSLFFNCLRIIAAGIAIGMMKTGSFLGIPLFIILYGVPISIIKYLFVKYGYLLGTSFIDTVFSSGLMEPVTKAASVLGLTMVGAMTATMVNVPVKLPISIGGAKVVIGDIINSIFPGILSIALVFFLVYLIKKRKVRITTLVLAMLVVGILGAWLTIF